jgi:hypothetical protein
MRFWQIIYRTGEEDFETKEVLIDDNQYKQIQKALIEGQDMIVMAGKPTIKRTSIVSINEATGIVKDYQSQGLVIPGLLAVSETPRLTGEVKKAESIKDFLARTSDAFKKKMGW